MFVGVTDTISENKMKGMIKPKLVNMILKNISSNQLFESEGDEGINSQVSMIENKLLNDWLDQDNDIEYENYMKENENYNDKREKILEETDMEFEDNSWTKIKCRG